MAVCVVLVRHLAEVLSDLTSQNRTQHIHKTHENVESIATDLNLLLWTLHQLSRLHSKLERFKVQYEDRIPRIHCST